MLYEVITGGKSRGVHRGLRSVPLRIHPMTGRAGRFDLILHGRADATPAATGLTESEVFAYLENIDAPRL